MITEILGYLDMGFSILPLRPGDKRPATKWELYRSVHMTHGETQAFWGSVKEINTDTYNVGIVTGKISGVDVIDVETSTAFDKLVKQYPELLSSAISRTTNGGYHVYVKHEPGLSRSIRVMPDIDYCGEGGYVVAPPSIISSTGYYYWINHYRDHNIVILPEGLFKIFKDNIKKNAPGAEGEGKPISFIQGERDNSLFTTALALFKQGWDDTSIEHVILMLAQACTPPMTITEGRAKVASARSYYEKHNADNPTENLKAKCEQWIAECDRIFTLKDMRSEICNTDSDYEYLKKLVQRAVKDRIIIPHGDKRGVYRKVEKEFTPIDLLKKRGQTVDIVLPFNLHNHIKVYPGNIILIAGEKDAGKTTFLLNMIMDNIDKWNIAYFNSEMGEEELIDRVANFDAYVPIKKVAEKVLMMERNDRFEDVLLTGPGNLNVIDFMEIHDEFWKIGSKINEIHKRLDGAIAVIAIQKAKGASMGRGGMASLEKPRIAFNLCTRDSDHATNWMRIEVAKNFKGDVNPRGAEYLYKILGGTEILQLNDPLHKQPEPDRDVAHYNE